MKLGENIYQAKKTNRNSAAHNLGTGKNAVSLIDNRIHSITQRKSIENKSRHFQRSPIQLKTKTVSQTVNIPQSLPSSSNAPIQRFGIGSLVGGGILGYAGYAAAAALNAANPLAWGAAAGIGGAMLLSYLGGGGEERRIRTPAERGRAYLDGAQHGPGHYPLETTARGWDGATTHRVDTGAGMVTFHRGRGNQPYIRSRANDFSGAHVGDDYDSLSNALSHPDPQVERTRAGHLESMSRGERPDISHEPPQVQRAMALTLGITQIAEEQRSRGSAGVARAGFRSIANGESNFRETFGRTDGRYTPAHVGGTDEMRRVVRGETSLHPGLSGNLSDHED